MVWRGPTNRRADRTRRGGPPPGSDFRARDAAGRSRRKRARRRTCRGSDSRRIFAITGSPRRYRVLYSALSTHHVNCAQHLLEPSNAAVTWLVHRRYRRRSAGGCRIRRVVDARQSPPSANSQISDVFRSRLFAGLLARRQNHRIYLRSRWTSPNLAEGSGAAARETALTSGPDDYARFAPDGSTILFSRTEGSLTSLYKMPIAGGAEAKVVDDALDGDWSPDGRRIAFVRSSSRGPLLSAAIWTIGADAQGAAELAQSLNGSLKQPRWSPDGRTIAAVQKAYPGRQSDGDLRGGCGEQ